MKQAIQTPAEGVHKHCTELRTPYVYKIIIISCNMKASDWPALVPTAKYPTEYLVLLLPNRTKMNLRFTVSKRNTSATYFASDIFPPLRSAPSRTEKSNRHLYTTTTEAPH